MPLTEKQHIDTRLAAVSQRQPPQDTPTPVRIQRSGQ